MITNPRRGLCSRRGLFCEDTKSRHAQSISRRLPSTMTNSETHYDVAIIGGGPGGSTCAALIKQYNPNLNVIILEKEKFPRDHVGESQLPPISDILQEMGCWDKVEAANFPIKIGATYRWGHSPELWDFEFLPIKDFKDEPRPAKYEGQRRQTAFQVDRLVYDDILLRHAESRGVEVREETQVSKVHRDGDRVTAFELKDGSEITATHYVDASGHVGLLRRAMGVETDSPTSLQNIAIYDYWENTEWAVEIGVGGTRVQVMSVGFGWIWFIPLGPTRTSIGLVCPAKYYKESGRKPEELYLEALAGEERIAALTKNATRRGKTETTTDWSFLAERTVGENWFLVGESAGFADPILAAGLTLTHTGAREAAYTILEIERGKIDADWMKQQYDNNQRARIRQHIRFADFWYAANGQFTDLQEYCSEIAKDAGLRMSPKAAWRWLAQGGFTNDIAGQVGIGGLDVAGAKQITQLFTDKEVNWQLNSVNILKLNLVGAEEILIPEYKDGHIEQTLCYVKGEKRLPMTGLFLTVTDLLRKHTDIGTIFTALQKQISAGMDPRHAHVAMQHHVQVMEVMLNDGWIIGKLDKKKPRLNLDTPEEGGLIHKHRDPEPAA